MTKFPNPRPRASDLDLKLGILPKGPHNSITDIEGVSVGHSTIVRGEGVLRVGDGPVRTGVTIIKPHQHNPFKDKVTAATYVLNGFGRSLGFMQVGELGTIESHIALTNTLNTWRVADALVDHLSSINPGVHSFNPIVGECNDSFLNDILGRHVTREHVLAAIESATFPNTEEGNVGAGAGTTAFGWKAGIGTSSRLCDSLGDQYTVGSLTLANAGDPQDLRIDGVNIGRHFLPPGTTSEGGGSIVVVIGTDAPITARQASRLARRSLFGLARVGGMSPHAIGDCTIVFSNSRERPHVDDTHLTPLFRGVVEATEEAMINSVLRAETVVGRDGNIRRGIPIDKLREVLANNTHDVQVQD